MQFLRKISEKLQITLDVNFVHCIFSLLRLFLMHSFENNKFYCTFTCIFVSYGDIKLLNEEPKKFKMLYVFV